ncbi:MAG: hypothetical protein ACI4VW_01110 [Acutalibacteraceae bacterium]
MSNDLMFRTSAFGGFKKNEVMDFIENILNEKSALERQLAACTAKTSQLSTQVASLQSELEDAGKLRSEIAELSVKINDFETAISDKDTLIKELTERLSKSEANSANESELSLLKEENAKLRDELDKKRDIERQVGAAMLDARVHSEELVEQAKERASSVTKAIYAAIGDTAVKIDDLSAGIGEIARNFTKSVEEVELRIKALTGDMSKTAQALISDSVLAEDSKRNPVEPAQEYDFSVSVQDEPGSVDGNIGDEDY